MQDRPVVSDWMTDWDHMDPAWTEDPYKIWSAIRDEKCPIAHTERYGGAYLPVNFNDIREIAYDTESFSSCQVVVRDTEPLMNEGAPPITTDPPKHRFSRMVIMPPFSPHEIKKLIPRTRELCNQLIDRFADKGEFDGAADYAQHIPVHVIAHMLGIPDSDADQFRTWIGKILIDGILDDDALHEGLQEVTQYMAAHLEERRRNPGNDLISYLAQQHYDDGEPLKEKHILGSLRLILIAGIDTTWSGIGASIWHLARTPSDRERLVREPELINSAVEEFLRAYAPVTMARYRCQRPNRQWLPDEVRRDAAAAVPCGQSRSQSIRSARRGDHRPAQQQARRLRHGHSPLCRNAPGAHGTAGCHRGIAETHSVVPAGRQDDVVARADPRATRIAVGLRRLRTCAGTIVFARIVHN